MNTFSIIVIAALGEKTRYIGKNEGLLWKLRKDMEHFKERTTGHPVIMGRKTWDSLPEKYRPLPNRSNIVITSNLNFAVEEVVVARSLDEALASARTKPGSEEIFIIGGARLYAEAVERGLADSLALTLVDSPDEGDVKFPEYQNIYNRCTFRSEKISEPETPPYYFSTFIKKSL